MPDMNQNAGEPEIEILDSQAIPYDDAGNASDLPVEEPVPPGAAAAAGEAKEWKKKHDEVKEQLLWTAAEFDNYKKRALKEKDEFLKFAQAGLLKEFLVVADNLERAVASTAGSDGTLGTLKQGVELTLRQFQAVMEKYGVTRIKAKGEVFDPRAHEVMLQEETDQAPEDTVLEELQAGYRLHDRVLRPALVKIAKKKA
ncbi:MAG TPA: nucleotide exchange factor GrpE [bacterium]|nr:nucleotide exchange factor GrpE [bacterium]